MWQKPSLCVLCVFSAFGTGEIIVCVMCVQCLLARVKLLLVSCIVDCVCVSWKSRRQGKAECSGDILDTPLALRQAPFPADRCHDCDPPPPSSCFVTPLSSSLSGSICQAVHVFSPSAKIVSCGCRVRLHRVEKVWSTFDFHRDFFAFVSYSCERR
jgi:hypothetical protein